MSGPLRDKDGRFKPKTGELPPKPQMPRDEHGQFIGREKVTSSKPYSKAVREMLDTKEGEIPDGWDQQKLTEAQALAQVHISMARAGNVQVGMMIVDRAEGKVPQAAEDREAAIKQGEGIKLLAGLLGIDLMKVVDVDIVPQPELPPQPEEHEVQTGSVDNPPDAPASDGDDRPDGGNDL